MSENETTFWKIVDSHLQQKFGYSVVSLELDSPMDLYKMKVNRFGAPESEKIQFTVFGDVFRTCLATGQVPGGLSQSFDCELARGTTGI